MITGLLVCAVLPLPGWLRFYYFHGDPLSPFFEFLKAAPDPRVMSLSAYAYVAGGEHTVSGYLRFLLHLAIPDSLGDSAFVLGIGAWATCLLVRARGTAAWFAICAASIALLEAMFSLLSPRFFLDSYFVAAMGLVVGAGTKSKWILASTLTAQCLITVAMASYAAISLAPGSLTPAWRVAVTNKAAHGVAAGRWLDRVLPGDAVINSAMHPLAMPPRPFVDFDLPNEELHHANLDELWRTSIARMRAAGINTIVLTPDAYPKSLAVLATWADPVAGPRAFGIAVRNPFNRGHTYQLQVWRLKPL